MCKFERSNSPRIRSTRYMYIYSMSEKSVNTSTLLYPIATLPYSFSMYIYTVGKCSRVYGN